MSKTYNEIDHKKELEVTINAVVINLVDLMITNNGHIPYGEAAAASRNLMGKKIHITPSALARRAHRSYEARARKTCKEIQQKSPSSKEKTGTEKKKQAGHPFQRCKKLNSTKKNYSIYETKSQKK